jgi:hypothetical protein
MYVLGGAVGFGSDAGIGVGKKGEVDGHGDVARDPNPVKPLVPQAVSKH